MLLCLMVFSTGLMSCSDDDGDFDASLLIGRWELVSYEGFYYMPDGERIDYNEPVYGEYAEFYEDGTVYYDGDSGTWSQSGNKLLITVYGDSEVFTVASLTGSELVLEVSGRDEDGEYFDRTSFRRVD